MRRWLIAAALLTLVASAIGSELASSLSLNANHCSCPIKGPCCEGPFCLMEQARQESQARQEPEECSMRSCGHAETVAAIVRPPCILFVVASLESRTPAPRRFERASSSPLRGISLVPDRPPRS
ncbi:MAG TPA: hypothetical protein VHW00_13840 [Thermoanaerobaculia bacterium]|nr:hypothetical protein [Thermoanaerobaculia bacterium]